MTAVSAALLLLFATGAELSRSGEEAEPAPRLLRRAAVHVHSSYSNGELTVLEIARLAAEDGVDVIVLTDSLLTRATFGLWPLDRAGVPGLNRLSRPGVLDRGLHRYLDDVSEARRRFPDVLIVPGVEVAPHYYWTGRPWDDLALRAFDRHLWVVGLSARDTANLPVVGNETLANTRTTWRRLWLPLLAGVAALGLLAARRRSSDRRLFVVARWGAWILLGVAAVTTWNNWPFGDLSRPDLGRDDVSAYQRLIDYVGAREGVAYWSYPEASYPDVWVRGARMVSAPHPEDLSRTDGYHGMEGLYGDDVRATEPGGIWDRILVEYLRGERRRAPFVVTGIDFHGPESETDPWSRLDAGTTFLLVADDTERGVVEALRDGHAYATFMGMPQRFELDLFEVETADGRVGTHGDRIRGSSPLVARFAIDWEGERPDPDPVFDVELIVDGRVAERLSGSLPLAAAVELDPGLGGHYVRLQAQAGRRNRLLTNPVFVDVR